MVATLGFSSCTSTNYITNTIQILRSASKKKEKRDVAFTTPPNYAPRISKLIHLKGWNPLSTPAVIVEPTSHTHASIQPYLLSTSQNPSPLDDFSALAFTSRTGISAFSKALTEIDEPPLSTFGETFTISALGRDSDLLVEDETITSKLCKNPNRIKILTPPIATPAGLIESLGSGRGRKKILCPVPLVVGLKEPPVVPDFLRGLEMKGWIPVRVDAYETRWAGERCAEGVVERDDLDAIVFTSTAEVEGLLKSLSEFYGLDWAMVTRRWPELVVAAHGPVTAAGAEMSGVSVDVVSSRFDSYDGVVDALDFRWSL